MSAIKTSTTVVPRARNSRTVSGRTRRRLAVAPAPSVQSPPMAGPPAPITRPVGLLVTQITTHVELTVSLTTAQAWRVVGRLATSALSLLLLTLWPLAAGPIPSAVLLATTAPIIFALIPFPRISPPVPGMRMPRIVCLSRVGRPVAFATVTKSAWTVCVVRLMLVHDSPAARVVGARDSR